MSFLEKFQNLPAEVTMQRKKGRTVWGDTRGPWGAQRLGERLHCSLAHAMQVCLSWRRALMSVAWGLGNFLGISKDQA